MLNTTIAHYKITAKLGQGGMGEVYRATDTKLGRDVAIKVLPEAVVDDGERLARFQREAELLASLNHPNIAAIYGLEDSGTSKALVLELVEGETLADRLKKGPMVVEDALETCLGIAEALEAAHEKGIIHRDLKPANVKFTSDGKVKVLDFGLAKALDSEVEMMTSTGSLADSPTITADYTKPGTILGTAAYMSPEQARGKGLDKRTDIWSFGCVLFECLTGKKLFQGEDVSETLASIIKGAPEWGALPGNTPPAIQLLLRKCLTKDRKRRLPDVGAARIDLADAIEDPSSTFIRLNEGALAESGSRGGSWQGIGIGFVIASLLGGVIVWKLKPIPETPAAEPPGVKQAEILIGGEFPIQGRDGNGLAVSRDGKRLVYNLTDSGLGLRVRDLESGEDSPLRGTGIEAGYEGSPFISWDGEDVGMVLDGKLVRLPISGGTARTLVEGVSRGWFRVGSWGKDGSIVFGEMDHPLRMVSEEGGDVREITELGDDVGHIFPQILPGGEQVLFRATKLVDGNYFGRAEVLNLGSGERKELGIGECEDVRYVNSGHVLYTKGNEVFAMVWDPERSEVVGKGKRVLDGVMQGRSDRSQMVVSEEGTLIYAAGRSAVGSRSLVWVEATGAGNVEVERFTEKSGKWDRFALSPDEKKVAIEEEGDLYIIEQVSEGFESKRRFVEGGSYPVWSGDGEWLYYSSGDGNKSEIWRKAKENVPGRGELVYAESEGSVVKPRSVEGDNLLATREGSDGDYDILRIDLSGEKREAAVMYGEDYHENLPQISPDGKWLSYYTVESGYAIYVAPMDGSSGGQMVSNGGGIISRWSGSGEEIYYNWGATIYSVKVIDGDGKFVRETPSEVLSPPFDTYFRWRVSKERERFLVLVNTSDIEAATNGNEDATPEPTHLKVVYNWFTELDELVPLDK